jgi:hypothetical protein
MSVSLNVTAFSDKSNPEFTKNYNAVKFCIENKLSFPKETSEFFKGKLGNGDSLEDFFPEAILAQIQHGIKIELPLTALVVWKGGTEIRIKVSEIPPEADMIIVNLC